MSRFSLFLSLTLLALSSIAVAEKFYKWVDENGVTHYDARPPQGMSATEVDTRTNASSSQNQEIEALNARREAASEARKANQEKAEEAQRLAEKPDDINQERCEKHKKNLDTLTNKPTVRRKNPDTGEMEVITQDVRDKMIEDAKKALEMCEEL